MKWAHTQEEQDHDTKRKESKRKTVGTHQLSISQYQGGIGRDSHKPAKAEEQKQAHYLHWQSQAKIEAKQEQ